MVHIAVRRLTTRTEYPRRMSAMSTKGNFTSTDDTLENMVVMYVNVLSIWTYLSKTYLLITLRHVLN